MKCVVVVQARMGSTRLPGKVLADLAGRPMLAQQLRRLERMAEADSVVVATSTAREDDAVERFCLAEGVPVVRGDLNDVLSRFVLAARAHAAEIVVRVTADCPLIDPQICDDVVRALKTAPEADYASNVWPRTFPRGLDVEAFHADVLTRMDRMARSTEAREHVTWFATRERPDLFARCSVADETDNSDLRWTVDTAADLEQARLLYSELELGGEHIPYPTILARVRAAPNLVITREDPAR